MSGGPKLYSFEKGLRAELGRLLFAAKGYYPEEGYHDVRLNRDQIEKAHLEAPFKVVPYLEFKNGRKIVDGLVLARALAHRFELAGTKSEERSFADMIATESRKVLDHVIRFRRASEQNDEGLKQSVRQELSSDLLPTYLGTLNQLVGESKQFFLGDQMSWADLAFYDVASQLAARQLATLSGYSNLQRIFGNVEREPNISRWLQKRPALN